MFGYGQWDKASQRQKNIIAALFDYQDSPLIADPLCRAISYYDGPDRWEVFAGIMRVLPLMPDDKDALTKNARKWLLNRLLVMESKTPSERARKDYDVERKHYADFEIAVLRYFARTGDRAALPKIRRLAKAKAFSSDGKRVQEAARAALAAFPRSN